MDRMEEGRKVEERRKCREGWRRINREVVVGVAGSEGQCAHPPSLCPLSSLLHSLPGANELLMAVRMGAMDQSSRLSLSPPPPALFVASPPG